MINLTINGREITAEDGSTIMEAARQNHIQIPNLCYMQGRHPLGSCRICVVEVEGARSLQASCITKAGNGMIIHTNSDRVKRARKVLYELLMSDHNRECLSCSRNTECELQALGKLLGVEETRFDGEHSISPVDISVSITRDMSKCILCRRCVETCNEIQGVGILNPQNRGFETVIGPGMDLPIGTVNCAFCGQCTVVCPVGALKETSSINSVWSAINDRTKRVVVQTAPAIRVAIGEEFGMEPGSRCTGKLASALFALGFDDVFDTNFTADLTIIEEGTEFLGRVKDALAGGGSVLPMITSCSPGWIKFIEHTYPDKLAHLSSCKSPHTMMGALVKSYYAKKIGVDPKDIYVVSVMPCTAKKTEINREEMKNDGLQNVDAVITTRELADMIKQAGIDFNNLPDREFDSPLGMSTGAADIFGLTGGVMEAALRTVYELVTGRELPFKQLHVTPLVGFDKIKEAVLKIEKPLPEYSFLDGVEVKVAVTSGLKNARVLLEQIVEGHSPYHFIEVMGCPGGCIMGGGQPRSSDPAIREKRLGNLYKEDESKELRKSHENPYVTSLYKEFLGDANGHLAHELLHTHYVRRGLNNELTSENFMIKFMKDSRKSEPVSASNSSQAANSSELHNELASGTRVKEQQHTREDLESMRVLALEAEKKSVKKDLDDTLETVDILKKVIADYTHKK